VQAFAGGISVLLCLVLAAAAAHKAVLLATGRGAQFAGFDHRAMSRRRRIHALAALGIAEAALAALVILSPTVGLIATAAMLGLYVHELRAMRPDADCNCLGFGSRTPARIAIGRNGALIAGAIAAEAVVLWVGAPSLTAASIGVAVVAAAALLAPWLLDAALHAVLLK
jgi:hypothetical protein